MPPPIDHTTETILTYEGIADYYATVEDDPILRSSIRKLLGKPSQTNRILELGCGPGIDANALKRAGHEVVAIDLCEAFINRSRMRFPEVDFQLMDLRNPEFDAESFDGILSMASLVHVLPEELPDVIRRCRRLLRPGGRLVVWNSDSTVVDHYDVPDWGNASSRYLRMWCHDRVIMKKAMEEAGFDQVRLMQVDSDYYADMKRIRENQISLYVAVGLAGETVSPAEI
ncbi:MAG: hypothetical protein CMJ40_10525 [Phycisphaerae bacterium]|nr:hypothetical protein [Phycisphaerae bacterium]|tara:strand:+ start:635 stop:1318 length:684 start_codon:yes stop_codon:yes gene_type:complete